MSKALNVSSVLIIITAHIHYSLSLRFHHFTPLFSIILPVKRENKNLTRYTLKNGFPPSVNMPRITLCIAHGYLPK